VEKNNEYFSIFFPYALPFCDWKTLWYYNNRIAIAILIPKKILFNCCTTFYFQTVQIKRIVVDENIFVYPPCCYAGKSNAMSLHALGISCVYSNHKT